MDILWAAINPEHNRPGAPGEYSLDHLSRREFLQQCRKGLLGLFTLPLLERGLGKERLVPADEVLSPAFYPAEDGPKYGRVLDNTLTIYKEPSFSSKLVKMYWRDLVLPINGVTIGDRNPAHNRVWYLVNHEGYAHSGKIQPVAIQSNPQLDSLPQKGALMEVTVPFTDALADPNRPDRFVYRLYYATTYWADRVVQDKQGQKWYHIQDDKYKRKEYFVSAAHLRMIPVEELTLLSPHVPPGEKRLEVRLKDQVLIAYESSRPVFMTRLASGAVFIEGNYTTPSGAFITSRKRPSRHMASGDLVAPSSYDLPGVPWVSYLTLKGISFHGTYWHNDFGKPRSHGCLNLSTQAARWVYRWTLPTVAPADRLLEGETGTRVDIIE